MFGNRFAKGLALLRIFYRFFKRGLRYAYCAGRNINATDFESSHDLLKALPFFAADQIGGRRRKIFKSDFTGVESFVAKFLNVAADRKSRRAFFSNEQANAGV